MPEIQTFDKDDANEKILFREIIKDKSEDEILIAVLQSLLKKGTESDTADIRFIKDHSVYTKCPLKCQKDIVSMWNTPHRVRSYIVVGVKNLNGKATPAGCQPYFDESFYSPEKLFGNGIFSSIPNYKYSQFKYQGKTFGIIEIQSSYQQGQPVFVKKASGGVSEQVSENQLWYQDGERNGTCQPGDHQYSIIFQWFLGKLSIKKDKEMSKEKEIDLEKILHAGNETSSDEEEPKKGDFTQFWEDVGGFEKGHPILIAGDVSTRIKYLENLALIPWVAVFDFDVISCSEGLLNAVQDASERQRQLRITTWKDPAIPLSENSTNWCFVRGRREFSDSRTDDRSFEYKIESPNSWIRTVRESLQENCDMIASFAEDYTVLTFVMLWPKNSQLSTFLVKFMDKIFESITHEPKIIVCLQERLSGEAEIDLKGLIKNYNNHISVYHIEYSQLCLGIGSKLKCPNTTEVRFALPKADSDVLPDFIDEKDAMWLKEDLEVLYLQSPYTGMGGDGALENEACTFYKGGTFRWFAWYELGDTGVDISRDVLRDVEKKVDGHMGKNKCSVVTILHAPGSGGSTLAQRVLWNFHTKCPCVQVRKGTQLRSKELVRKIEFLHDKTHLTTLILVDGEDDLKVKYLSTVLRHTIILHVKRFPHKIPNTNQKGDKVYVKGVVSQKEANALALKFGERCKSSDKHRIAKLKTDVVNGKPHSLYEFGMTVYSHEFKGIVSYVKGYLDLQKNGELLPWQQCLGYLSLVYFYSQSSVPC